MFEVKVTVDFPGIPEAINHLAEALAGMMKSGTKEPAAVETAAVEAPKQTVQPVQAEAPKEEPKKPEAPKYDLDAIGRAGAALVDAGKMPQLLDLLKKFGVQAITQLKPDRYNDFVAGLIELGAAF